ncbi:mercury transporter [Streptomyces sp. A3M-1-3]|uniref:mercury transporter n=1 Tax=Streptomyces sp. A3M-1-3 TaxID=2962044 RepID=UPI0020B8531A|nr:mercury transporter [Streptomyces sp. A3M-1-3]MCP3818842.1 mercury transporter [Streptomyces sp. A3M-1-3]
MTRPPAQPGDRRGGLLGTVGMVGVVLLPIICCAGPVLLAGGALAGLGGVLGSPWLLVPAAVLPAGALAWWLRRRSSAGGDSCCPPATRTDQHDRDLLRKP